MILMLSGEGKSDMGQMMPGVSGIVYEPGPMAWMVDRLAKKRLDYSLLEKPQDTECVKFVSERELTESDRPSKPGQPLLRGLKRGKNTQLFTRNAQVLGLLAKNLERNRQEDVIAVLFRDADKTNACNADTWEEKRQSIENGFALAEFRNGVPMVPRPKSEAWLLCALKNPPYQHCNTLEEESGNDNSPRSLKSKLETLIGHKPAAQEQAHWIRTGRIDPEQIDMPSFTAFREALNRALNTVVAR
ncbi:MAG: hypothetical protein IPL99_08605 [Candidatus Competibacteraceae bacterium]|nr:hypothetical protein [Candidatus Competibacteraceae bacterium]